MAWIVVICLITALGVIVYALRRGGDMFASMSLGKILEFKLDVKERRTPRSAGKR